jgi:hypothetical protein
MIFSSSNLFHTRRVENGSKAIVCDNSLLFSESAFMREITRIIIMVIAKGLPITGKSRIFDSSFNNRWLGYRREQGEKHEMIRSASIFGGTSA